MWNICSSQKDTKSDLHTLPSNKINPSIYCTRTLPQKSRGALGRLNNSGTAPIQNLMSCGSLQASCIPTDGYFPHFEETKLEVLFEEVLHILKAPNKKSRINSAGRFVFDSRHTPHHTNTKKKVQGTLLNFLKKNETTRKLRKKVVVSKFLLKHSSFSSSLSW